MGCIAIDKITAYGVYVVADNGYVKITRYNHDDRFVDFKYLNEIPCVQRKDQTLKLIVYVKDVVPTNLGLEIRPINTVVDIKSVNYDVTPMSQTDMFEITVNTPVKDGVMLQMGSFGSYSIDVIMLGDTQKELATYFGNKDLPDANMVKQYLDDARVAFPDNADLKNLSVYWDKAANKAADLKGYTYVEEKWNAYQEAEKISLKARYLEELLGEINGYLNDHPDGVKSQEAKERVVHAEEKLKEFEKLV